MESDAVREQLDELGEQDKGLRRNREALKKKIRRIAKEIASTKTSVKRANANPLPSSTNNNPTLDARPITTEERQYAYSKANYEGRKKVRWHTF